MRAEFGYPIMVTPLSQYVGTQAAINVIVGERYKEVPDQVIQYALGLWGKEAIEVMDKNISDKILSRPRAKEWTHWEQPEPTLHEIRQKYGANLSDEDLILHYFAGDRLREGVAQWRQAARISGRHATASEDHRTACEAQRFESGLHQAARLHDQNGETPKRLGGKSSEF